MANKKASPGRKRICFNFTLPENIKPKLQKAADYLDISMSKFVESAITEKMERILDE